MPSNIDSHIDYCLRQWAKVYGNDNHGLGFPTRTCEARIKDEGGVLISSVGQRREPENIYAEEAECWLILLRANNSLAAKALEDKYTHGKVSQSASIMKISYEKFNSLIKQAESFIAGILASLKTCDEKKCLNLYRRYA